MSNAGENMYNLCKKLFPICRSITGPGFRESLDIIKDYIGMLETKSIPSGSKVLDWTVPKEWIPRSAKLLSESGDVIIDFDNNNLHLLGYSSAFNGLVTFGELEKHLHYLKNQPDAIPYVTSYYKKRWGFCLSYKQFLELDRSASYIVQIDTELVDGVLNYGEVILPGKVSDEIFFSTYLCHPSMANNELSGPALCSELVRYVKSIKERHYTYRFLFGAETIGAIAYLEQNLSHLKKNTRAGYVLTCVGDNKAHSFMPSRTGNTEADKTAEFVLNAMNIAYKRYSFLQRGSDERQYCSPTVNLPMASVMRSKYGEYPEYHTSLDDLSFISPNGLQGSFDVYTKIINVFENNFYYRSTVFGEPQMGKRNLYPDISTKSSGLQVRDMMNFLAYCDGDSSLMDISEIIGVSFEQCANYALLLQQHNILKRVD